jgi:hypothetical protein
MTNRRDLLAQLLKVPTGAVRPKGIHGIRFFVEGQGIFDVGTAAELRKHHCHRTLAFTEFGILNGDSGVQYFVSKRP